MPRAVTLRREILPAYPDMCVRCAKPNPADTLDPLSHWLIPPSTRERTRLAGDPLAVPQPYCTGCKSFTWLELWARRLVLAAAAAAIANGIYKFRDSEAGPVVHTEYAFIVCGVLLWFAFWMVLPLPLRISLRQSKLRYHFRKKAVGNAFFAANTPRR